jgi:hypothetical protein
LLEEHPLAMTLVSSAKLSDHEKLKMLRRLDQFRQWHSLDEKRYCLVCGEIITGREINVIAATGDNGPTRIICPTEHCNATPMEWVQPTDDVLIRIAMIEFERLWLRQVTRAGQAIQSLRKKQQVTRSTEQGPSRESANICEQDPRRVDTK